MNPISQYSEQARSHPIEDAWRRTRRLRSSLYYSLALLVLLVAGFLAAKRSALPKASTVPEAAPAARVQQDDSPLVIEVDFRRQILPIFTEHCNRCHGPEKRRSGLLLPSSKAALEPADSGLPAIVPGNRDKSELIRRVVATDAKERMPPGDHPLSDEQIGLLRDWIDQGAVWPGDSAAKADHWAYKKPVRPALPTIALRDWPLNPVDNFILARLENEGLTPSPATDRDRLIRRLFLDLIGLPPTVEQVDAFVNDHGSDAYERV